MRSRDLSIAGRGRGIAIALTALTLVLTDDRVQAAEPSPELLEALAHGRDGAQVARAAETLLKEHRSHPRASEAAELAAQYAYARGEYKTAARHYATAIELTRDSNVIARRHLWRSRALAAAGDVNEARSELEAIGTRGPFAAEAELGLADCAFLSGKTDRAIHLYQNFLRRRDSSALTPIAQGQLALVLERGGRTEEALALSRELVQENPSAHEAAAARERIRRSTKQAAADLASPPDLPAKSKAEAAGSPSKTPAKTPEPAKAGADPAPESRSPGTTSRREAGPAADQERRLESGVGESREGRYALQIGAFGDRVNAADLAHQLEQLGLPLVRVEEEMRGSRRFYRVRCGAYPDPAAAEAAGQGLKSQHGLAYRVVER
jgi:cell division protein FtsN